MTKKTNVEQKPIQKDKTPVNLPSTPPLKTEKKTIPISIFSRRVQTGLFITLFGLIFFVLGARPNLFGLDRSPVMGFVQLTIFVLSLGTICLGGYLSLNALWKNQKLSIAFEFGARFLATGYLISVFAGLADIIGMGSHKLPLVFYGPLQSFGVLLGQGLSAIGLLMMIPFNSGLGDGKKQGTASVKSS